MVGRLTNEWKSDKVKALKCIMKERYEIFPAFSFAFVFAFFFCVYFSVSAVFLSLSLRYMFFLTIEASSRLGCFVSMFFSHMT